MTPYYQDDYVLRDRCTTHGPRSARLWEQAVKFRRKMPQDIPWRTWSDLLFTQRDDVHVCSSLGPEGWHRVAELRIVRPEQTGPLKPWPKLLVRLDADERWWPAADLHVRQR